MSQNPYDSFQDFSPSLASQAKADVRSEFLRKTYLHLLSALLAFAGLCAVAINVFDEQIAALMPSLFRGYNWLFFMGGVMLVSYLADRWAQSNISKTVQYFGLSIYVVAEAAFFVPLLYLANQFAPGAIASAGIVTGVVFGGLTLTVLLTKSDFSFLRSALAIGGFASLGLVACAVVFGFPLGVWFSVAMVVLAAGAILYQTSTILHHYNTEQYVAASLALFASITLLFWYVLRLFMQFQEE
jgi:hypothetical protein